MKDMSLVRTLSDVSPKSHPPLHTIKMTNFVEKKFICLMTGSTNVRKKTRIMLMIFSTPMIVTKFDSYILRYITQVSRVKVQSFRPKPKK